jgi:glycerophosphoryl diester phosphodiesterase
VRPTIHRTTAFTLAFATVAGLGTALAPAPAAVDRPVLVIAHRGASGVAPEHTFTANDLAVGMDVDMLECDLQLTADEVLVCVHDTTVDRTSDGTGRVDASTLAELRALDWGSWFAPAFAGEAIVPFEEQLDCYLRTDPLTRFHVETKGPDTYDGRMEALLVELLDRKGLLATGEQDARSSTIVVQSFDPESLRLVRDATATLPTALLWPSFSTTVTPALLEAQALFPLGMLPEFADVAAPSAAVVRADPLLVERFHLNGHDVHTYTVNDTATMQAMVDAGVDGVFPNFPDRLRSVVDAAGVGTDPSVRPDPAAETGCAEVRGRVTGPDGPGDVWAPVDGGRGVVLVDAVEDRDGQGD